MCNFIISKQIQPCKAQEPNAPAEEQAACSAPAGGVAAGALPVDQPGGEVWPIDCDRSASQARPRMPRCQGPYVGMVSL